MIQQVPIRRGMSGAASARVDHVEGRTIVLVEVEGEQRRGALTLDDGETIAAAASLAHAQKLPLVIYLSSSGADIGAGISALHGWGTAAREIVRCSGVVPVIVVATGPTVGGPALILGLADVVVMTADAYAFVSGPQMVKQFTGIPTTSSDLGGASTHGRTSGAASFVVADRAAVDDVVAELVALLPSSTDEEPPRLATGDPVDRLTPEAYELIPDAATGSYDVRDVISVIVDDGIILEPRAQWAANLVTAFATIGGRPVGIVANQPQTVAGTLDIAASQKGGRFVAFCDAFNLPLITLVDTSGFYPGKDLEWRGMIRYGAQMAFAYARATVPRVSVTLRKSYGGAYIVMDSKYMGNDIALAWPSAEIAVMGAKGAVEILHRKASPEERAELQNAYEERLLNPYIAAERGSIDMVIDPSDTRREVAAALEMLAAKRERLPRRRHDNSPL